MIYTKLNSKGYNEKYIKVVKYKKKVHEYKQTQNKTTYKKIIHHNIHS